MVKIDHKVREVIADIKMREAELAHSTNKIEDATSQKSYFLYRLSCTSYKFVVFLQHYT